MTKVLFAYESAVLVNQGANFSQPSFLFVYFLSARLSYFSAVSAGGSYEPGLIRGVNRRSFVLFQSRSAKHLPGSKEKMR